MYKLNSIQVECHAQHTLILIWLSSVSERASVNLATAHTIEL